MEIQSNKFYFLIVFLFGIIDVFAGPGGSGPPPPTARRPVPPPGLSIDENSIIMVSIALLFGIYIVYVNMLKTKTPI